MAAVPKKMLILAILEILRKNTDAEHRMLQADIMAQLESDYELTATRKSVSANLTELVAAGYPLEYRDGWYYEHEFSAAELNLLTDSLMYNPNIPYTQCRDMIGKLRDLGGKWYRPFVGQSMNRPSNPQFMYSFDVLNEAIATQKRVTFQYGDYGIDKQLHPRTDKNGRPKVYDINPYRVVVTRGLHFLICNVQKYNDAAHFRVDHIMNIKLTDLPLKDSRQVQGLESGLDTPKYLSEHVYMFSGQVVRARIRIKKNIVSETLDWFGMDVDFENETQDSVDALVRTDESSLHQWLNTYSDSARRIK